MAVITGVGQQGPVGMTTNALCSLSLEPLLLLVCFDQGARTLPVVRASGRFGVNLLRADQGDLSRVFASKLPQREKFADARYRIHDGVPLLAGTLGWLTCDLRETHPGGDHTIGIGEVREMGGPADGDPLVWYRGDYRGIT